MTRFKGYFKLLYIDFKTMGFLFCFPLMVLLIDIVYAYVYKGSNLKFAYTIPVLEFTIPLLMSWWIAFANINLFEGSGYEILYVLPYSKLLLGIIKVILIIAFYLMVTFLSFWIISYWYGFVQMMKIFCQLIPEVIFYAGLSFVCMVAFSNASYSLATAGLYSVIQILSKGNIIPILNIYFFNAAPLDINDIFFNSMKSLIYGLIFIIGGQYIIFAKRY